MGDGYRLEAYDPGASPGEPLHVWASIAYLGTDRDAALLRLSAERLRFKYSPVRFRVVTTDGDVVEEATRG